MAETELRAISQADGLDVYDMLQSLPKDENGFMNGTGGKTYEEYKEKPKTRNPCRRGLSTATRCRRRPIGFMLTANLSAWAS